MTVIDTNSARFVVGGAARRARLAAQRDKQALQLIESEGPKTREQLQAELELPRRSAYHLLERLLRRQAIEKREGVYVLAVTA